MFFLSVRKNWVVMVLALQDSGHFLLLPISDLCKCKPAAYLQNEAVKQ